MNWKRSIALVADHFAVPVAAAVVGWIVTAAWVVPHLPAAFTESVVLGSGLEAIAALVAFVLARRFL